MKVIVGYLIMVAGVWLIAYAVNWQQTPTPHDEWLFFPFMVTFFAIELLGSHLSGLWEYF